MAANKEPREWRMTNAAVVATGARWYPFAESGAPTHKDYEEQFPLKNYGFDNTSDNDTTLILDPQPTDSPKRYKVAGNKSRETDPNDRMKFHNVVVINDGADNVGIGELRIVVRNY